jgi:hypothetical protein
VGKVAARSNAHCCQGRASSPLLRRASAAANLCERQKKTACEEKPSSTISSLGSSANAKPSATRSRRRRFNATLGAKRYSWFWPKISAALTAKHPWVVIACDSWAMVNYLDLRMKPAGAIAGTGSKQPSEGPPTSRRRRLWVTSFVLGNRRLGVDFRFAQLTPNFCDNAMCREGHKQT